MAKVVNQTELAEIHGVTDVTLWQWQKEGMPVAKISTRGLPNEYEVPATIVWRVAREVKKVREESPRDMLYREQTKFVQLQIAEKQGLLVPAADIEQKFERLVVNARQRLMQLPPLMRGRLPPEVLTQLEEAIHGALTELASYGPSDPTDHPGAEEVGAADAPLDGGVGGGEEVPERQVPVPGEVRPLKDPVSS
jgi:phage terminase Nu1 subunit (DNA packaging protein)